MNEPLSKEAVDAIVRYTLEQAAKNVHHKHRVYDSTFIIDKSSITSLREKIVDDLTKKD